MENAWIYKKNLDNTSRYILGTVGENPLICIGVNPSTAKPENLDPTLKSVARIAAHNGNDSWIMLNLYPQRAVNPDHMDLEANQELIYENYKHIQEFAENYNQKEIWVAWGTLIAKRNYLKECAEEIYTLLNRSKFICFGDCTKDGHPHHPLYLSANSPKHSFDFEGYLL